MSVQAEINSLQGAGAPPRSNGELVFEEPWQARAFGVAVGLVQAQGIEWTEFQRRLIEEIAEHDGDSASYYEHWLEALERLVVETRLASATEVEEHVRHVRAEDHHDHPHDH